MSAHRATRLGVKLRPETAYVDKLSINRVKKVVILPECDSCSFRQIDLKAIARECEKKGTVDEVLLVAPWHRGEKSEVEIPQSLSGRLAFKGEFMGLTQDVIASAPSVFNVSFYQEGNVTVLKGEIL